MTPDPKALFNEVPEGAAYPANEKWHAHLLDQYKLYVEMADRISSRRATANTYFLTLNTAVIGSVAYLKTDSDNLWLLALAGIALSVLWRVLIRSYRDLNTAKWLVVHQIETRLAIRPYEAEWDAMGRGMDPKRYRPMSHIEMAVPVVFVVLHAAVLVLSIVRWLR